MYQENPTSLYLCRNGVFDRYSAKPDLPAYHKSCNSMINYYPYLGLRKVTHASQILFKNYFKNGLMCENAITYTYVEMSFRLLNSGSW